MPMHDWTRMHDGDYHHFHQRWIQAIADNLNGGLLPPEFMALSDSSVGRPIPDVVTLQTRRPQGNPGGVAVAASPPSAKLVRKIERNAYAKRADRILVRHGRGRVVAVIEIVSPGNKSSQNAITGFVEKAADLLDQGVHLLVVDPFPPATRDPHGLQKLILDQFDEQPFDLPADQPLTVGSYQAGDMPTAYIETLAVGDSLPSLPLFLTDAFYIPAPLEATYQEAWRVFPTFLKELMDAPTA